MCFITDISTMDVFGLEFVNYFSKCNQVSVITLSGYDVSKVDSGVDVYRLRYGNRYGFLRVVRTVKQLLKNIEPDVIVSLNMDGHALVSALSGFHPFVLFSYGSDVSYNMFLSFYRNIKFRFILFKADKVFSQDKMMLDRLLRVGVEPGKIEMMHWGVDTSFFYPNKRVEKVFDVINIHGYNTTFYRYVDLYLKALALLKDKGFFVKAVLLGNTGFYDDLIDELGIGDVLCQAGFQQREEFRGLLWESRLLVDPMYPCFHDGCGFGMGLVQAMGCGTPVLCADRRGVLLDGVDRWFYGGVFRHCDVFDMVDKIMCLLGDEQMLETISYKNYFSVLKNFDKRKNMFCIEDKIRGLV